MKNSYFTIYISTDLKFSNVILVYDTFFFRLFAMEVLLNKKIITYGHIYIFLIYKFTLHLVLDSNDLIRNEGTEHSQDTVYKLS